MSDGTTTTPGVKPVVFSDVLRQNFLTYAGYVIKDRSLPDVRDGLKPVHRRILWTMWEMGCKHNAKAKKSGRIVGDCMGKYHPHGDKAIYDAMVRMAQSFSMNIPLVDGQGNFGSLDGDSPAAQRYTEARLARFAEDVLFADIDFDTVDFIPNYDDELQEPTVLPARVPLILMTSASGIAVGMATNILPFNLGEVCDSVIALLDNPSLDIEALLGLMPAPDFPLGGSIKSDEGLRSIFETGRGSLQYRVLADFETEGTNRTIVLKDVPYSVNKGTFIEEIAALVRDGKIDGVADVRDESTKAGVRICVELKARASHEAVLNALYNYARLQSSLSLNLVAIERRKPKQINVLNVLKAFVEFRREVIRRRVECQKKKAQDRLELVEAMLWVGEHVDEVVETVQHAEEPTAQLVEMGLTNRQADYVYQMPLRRLSNEDQSALDEERMELQKFIAESDALLSDAAKVDDVIRAETLEIKERYAVPRRTIVTSDFSTISTKEMVKEQDVALVFLSDGTVKATPVSDYRLQKRRGRGVIGVRVPDGVYPTFVATVSTHDDVMLITDQGNRYLMHGYAVPASERGQKPRHISEYVPEVGEGERVVSVVKAKLDDDESLVILGAQGSVKKQSAATVMKARPTTTLFYPVDKGGEVIGVVVAKNDDDVVLTTAQAQVLRTPLSDIREVGARTSAGVRGIKLAKGDKLLSVSVVDPSGYMLTVSKSGFAKRTPMSEFMPHGRGGRGVRGCRLPEGDELVFASAVSVSDEDTGLFVMTSKSMAIRLRLMDVREVQSRNGMGTQVKAMSEDEYISTVSVE